MLGEGSYWAVLLAAGAGTRFGGGKLLAPWRGGCLIEGALEAALAAPVVGVVAVTGFDAPAVAAAMVRHASGSGQSARLRIVEAAGAAAGMSASLKAGLAALRPDARGAFLFLGDMPEVETQTAADLAGAIGDAPAAAPVWRGRRGHPVLIARALFPAFLELTGDQGGRSVLDALGDRLVRVEASGPGVLFDIDRAEDLGGVPGGSAPA